MRFIPTTAHGLADYIVGLVVVGLPFYFGWTGTSRIAFVTLGLLVICYSLLTDYALSPPAGRSVRLGNAGGPDVAPPPERFAYFGVCDRGAVACPFGHH
jgi:hypothetical protein